jgi:hypothetical protein
MNPHPELNRIVDICMEGKRGQIEIERELFRKAVEEAFEIGKKYGAYESAIKGLNAKNGL